ncbi:MAG: VIT and VWA domain-containing protein [Lachnospiraceae bacterium]
MKKYKRKCCFLGVLLLLMLFPVSPVRAQEEEQNEDKTGAPYFYVESKEVNVDSFPLKKTNVIADINGMIADIHVRQSYANEGKSPINACYVFPASTKVTVHGMQMQIGDQLITAKIKEKEEAKQEFEEAKEEGKSASLLSEERPNVFTMNIANIMPGDNVSIDLHYTELITPTDGTYQFVYPTVVGPRYVGPVLDDCGTRDEWTAAPYLPEGTEAKDQYDIHVNLSAAVPITELTSSSHEISVQWEQNTKAAVSLADASDYAGNRDFILDYKMTGQEISTGMMLNTGENENFFMLMVQPPERYEAGDIPPREYIFVLDVSGSMSGYPLDTAKALIKNLVSDLRETDSFNLVLFSGASVKMSDKSLPASSENIKRAIKMIDDQEGGGGTELAPALRDALAIPAKDEVSRSIVIITDGYIYGEEEIFDIIHQHTGDTDFFPFGIGRGVNRYLIEGIAKTGQGEPFVVTQKEEASDTAERFKTYIQSPVLTDIQVKFDGFYVYDVEPSVLPTLFAQRPIVLLGKWRGEPAGSVEITGKTGSGDYTQTISIDNSAAVRMVNAKLPNKKTATINSAEMKTVANLFGVNTAAVNEKLSKQSGSLGVNTVLDINGTVQSGAKSENPLVLAVTLESDVLSYLWAQKRIERLTDYGLNDDNPDVKAEVTNLGLTYSMLTPYTSFIAVTETVRNPDKNSKDVKQPLSLPLEVSNFAVGGYLFGSEPAEILMLAALVLILLLQMPRVRRLLHKEL